MRTVVSQTLLSLLVVALVALTACQTSQPGVKSSYAKQWANVNGDTVAATNAAKGVLEELKLRDIEARSTGVDGHAHGFKADGSRVSIDVTRIDDKTSEVSVAAGSVGDPELGKDIIGRIQKKVGGAPEKS